MRQLTCPAALITATLLWGSPAAADVTDFTGQVESVTIPGPIEMPLYLTPTQQSIPSVKVTIQGKEYLFGLHAGHGIHVFSRAAKVLELKPRKKKFRHYPQEAVHYAALSRMVLGSMELKDIRVSTDDMPIDPALRTELEQLAGQDHMLDGIIGLQSLPQVSWAILPSQGKVLFAPASQGQDMLAGLRAPILRYRSTPEMVEIYGRDTKIRMPQGDLIVPVQVGGQAAEVHLQFLQSISMLRTDRTLPPSATQQVGDRSYTWQSVQFSNIPPAFSWFYRSGEYQRLSDTAFRNRYADGEIGNLILSQMDVAVDPVTKSIALRPTAMQNRMDPIEFLLADARAATEPDGDEPASPAAWSRLGDLYAARGRLAEAIDAYSQPLQGEAPSKDCMVWLTLGSLQLSANRTEDAIASFGQASALYHSWWDLPQEERESRSADEESPHTVQPSACHTADSRLAAAHLSVGDLDMAVSLYTDRMDLDAGLAQVAGNAYLLQGDLDRAQSAYRQAIQHANGESAEIRLGLGLAYEEAGQADNALQLYAAAAEHSRDPMVSLMWLDAMSRTSTPEQTFQAAIAFLRKNPDFSGAYLVLARAHQRLPEGKDLEFNKEEELERLLKTGSSFFARAEMLTPYDGTLQAAKGMFFLETGRISAARLYAEEQLLRDPGNPMLWLLLGNTYILEGDIDRGERLLRRAGRIAPDHPAYALLSQAAVPRPTADAGDVE